METFCDNSSMQQCFLWQAIKGHQVISHGFHTIYQAIYQSWNKVLWHCTDEISHQVLKEILSYPLLALHFQYWSASRLRPYWWVLWSARWWDANQGIGIHTLWDCETNKKAVKGHSFLIANHYRAILLKTAEDSTNTFHISSLRSKITLKESPNTAWSHTVLISSPIWFLNVSLKPNSWSRLSVMLRIAKTLSKQDGWECSEKAERCLEMGEQAAVSLFQSIWRKPSCWNLTESNTCVFPGLSRGLAESSFQLLKPCTSALQICQLPLQDGLQHVYTWYLATIIERKWKMLLIHCKQMGTVKSQANFPKAGSLLD